MPFTPNCLQSTSKNWNSKLVAIITSTFVRRLMLAFAVDGLLDYLFDWQIAKGNVIFSTMPTLNVKMLNEIT